jgi:Xaa-Pro dipeptidase
VILHHKTLFGIAEHSPRSVARADAARERLEGWLAAREDVAGVVLTSPGSVAWATGAVSAPVDRTAQSDLVWVVATPTGAALVTTEVEADRITEEYQPRRHGFADLVAVPWHDPGAFIRAAQDIAGADAGRLAADGHPAFQVDATEELIGLRLTLSPAEQEDLRELGADAADALQGSLMSWRPGERDLDIQGRVAELLESRGADAPVLIVGGDERVRRFRHPMAVGAPVRQLAMAVVVARRGGLHAAATRFASAGPPPAEFATLRARVLRIERDTLAACVPPNRYGDVLAVLDQAYAREGAPGGWAGHYQGGPIGYAQREFEIAPSQRDSRWYATPVRAGQAMAWNPSLPGGAKAEDTYLLSPAGPERITAVPAGPGPAGVGPLSTGSHTTGLHATGLPATGPPSTGPHTMRRQTTGPAWPAEDDELVPPRPAVLEVA